jgi:hypothetical protein
MSSTFSASVKLDLVMNELITDGIRNGVLAPRFTESLSLATGTSDGQINLGYYVSATGIAASSTTAYDLAGSLTDESGATMTFAETCLIAMRNTRTTALATLTIGPDATNGHGVLAAGRGYWAAALGSGGGSVVHPGGGWTVLYAPDGVLVGAGSTDELSVIASAVVGDTNSWDLIVLGRSA